jgi:tRNA/tmRNA/rRNA uracil-C5-methylase (TrmA/RlmC/RlmD family)
VHLPPQVVAIAAVLNDFVRSSPLMPYDTASHCGTWRSVTVRWSPTLHEAMVIITLQPGRSSVESHSSSVPSTDAMPAVTASPPDQATVSAELERLCSVLLGDPGLRVVSVYGQSYSGLSQPPPNHPFQLLRGKASIVDELCGMKFTIGPAAFFQVNTFAAEILYGLVRAFAIEGAEADLAAATDRAKLCDSASVSLPIHSDVALLDVCCGTGTIGIVCSPFFGRVVGVELSEGAIEDAIVNARQNDIRNAVFVCSRAEDAMSRLLTLASQALPGGDTYKANSASGAAHSSSVSVHAPDTTRSTTITAELEPGNANAQAASARACDADVDPLAKAATVTQSASSGETDSTSLSTQADTGTTSGSAIGGHTGTGTSGLPVPMTVRRVVAIVDPPRCGLHVDVIKALR